MLSRAYLVTSPVTFQYQPCISRTLCSIYQHTWIVAETLSACGLGPHHLEISSLSFIPPKHGFISRSLSSGRLLSSSLAWYKCHHRTRRKVTRIPHPLESDLARPRSKQRTTDNTFGHSLHNLDIASFITFSSLRRARHVAITSRYPDNSTKWLGQRAPGSRS